MKEITINTIDYLELFKDRKHFDDALKQQFNAVFEYLRVYEYGDKVAATATVRSLGFRNTTVLRFDQNRKLISFNCSCGAKELCVHAGILLKQLEKSSPIALPFEIEETKDLDDEYNKYLKLRQKEMEERQEKFRQDKVSQGKQWIDHVKNDLYDSILKDESVHPEQSIQLELSKVSICKEGLLLKYRIGTDKKYSIKSIDEFLEAVDQSLDVYYGKSFHFVHRFYAFDEHSRKTIDLFKEIRYRRSISQNELIAMDRNIDLVFRHYENADPIYHPTIQFIKEGEKIPLLSEEFEDLHHFYLDEKLKNNLCLSTRFAYLLKDDKLHQIALHKNTLRFLGQLLKEDLWVDQKDMTDLYRYVLKGLDAAIVLQRDFGKYETVAVEDIQLYADINDQQKMDIHVDYLLNGEKKAAFKDQTGAFEIEIIERYIKKYTDQIKEDTATIEDEETMERFAKEALPFLSDYANIFISDTVKQLQKPSRSGIRLGVNVESNLLELSIDSIKLKKEEFADVLNSFRRNKKFHLLKNGELFVINPKEWEEVDEVVKELDIKDEDLQKDKIEVPLYRSMNIASFKKENIEVKRSQDFEKLLGQFETKELETYKVPDTYANILRDYQVFGYRWMRMIADYGFGGIVADDMGLGKTLQAIAYLESVKSEGTSIVVTPASLVYNWEDEIHKFTQNLKTICITKDSDYRAKIIQEAMNYDVVITSYDYLRRDIDLYQNHKFNTIIIDEAQNIKNHTTKNAQSVKELKASHRFALSGTPIENSLAELWSIFDFLMPGYLLKYKEFQEDFEKPIIKEEEEEASEELKALVEPFILRRTKQDVLKELPEKIEQTIIYHFNETEEKAYQASAVLASKELQKMLDVKDVASANKVSILSLMTRLRQLCNEPRLVYKEFKEPSTKMVGCLELIDKLISNKQKMLVFSSFTSILEFLKEELDKKNIPNYLLTGSTSKEERKELVKAFQSDETPVFLISLKAGGTGLNLTAASAVIHFDPWWNYSAQKQASDRVHRIGQDDTVQVYYLIMKDSIEEKIQLLQKRKKELSDVFIEGNSGSIASMTKEELLELFK